MSRLLIEIFYINEKNKINYNLNALTILNTMLGYLTKKGKKGLSFYFFISLLVFLKKGNKEKPIKEIYKYINKIKPSILLYNKRKGTLLFELPRFLSIEKSLKKSIEWFIKLPKKRKKKMLEMLYTELINIKDDKGEVLKKRETIILKAEENKPFYYLLKKRKK